MIYNQKLRNSWYKFTYKRSSNKQKKEKVLKNLS